MSRIVYVNGQFVPEEEAKISIFDRGFLFADGVYEVSSVIDGKLIDNAGHLVRLARSLKELKMAAPCSDDEITSVPANVPLPDGIEKPTIAGQCCSYTRPDSPPPLGT